MDDYDRDPFTGSPVPCVVCGMAPQHGGTGCCSSECLAELRVLTEKGGPMEEESVKPDGLNRFVTELGCTIMVVPAPDHLGDGVLMVLRMEQPNDGRWCEVYLSRENMRTLRALLDGEVG